jgi:hypothetical protein
MNERISKTLCALLLTGGVLSAQSVVINEIHYNEDDATVHSEFIELHNPGVSPVDLSGWYFSDGIPYVFPAGTVVAAGGYLVVAEDPATLQAKFGVGGAGVLNWNAGLAVPVYNRLKNNGETIVLRTAGGVKADEVDYALGFPWPTVGDPPNYSIELIHPSLDNGVGGHWRASDGQAVAQPAVTYVAAGSAGWRYRKALSEASTPDPAAWRFPGFPANDGTWLTSAGGAPFGYGETVDTELADMRGAYSGIYMRHTFEFTGSVPGPLTLRVTNDDGFIAWLNGVEIARFGPSEGVFVPFNGLAGRNHEGPGQPPDTVTLTSPNAILQQGTNVLAIHALNVELANSSDFYIDAELGTSGGAVGAGPTPGRQNSVFSANAAPAIRQVTHAAVVPDPQPEWPATGQAVRVSALITDPQGVATATLEYQVVAPGDYITRSDARYAAPASWVSVAMRDDGLGGDTSAGDGFYSAVIPGSVQQHRRLIRYRITAADAGGATVRVPYADDPQPNFAYFVYDGVPEYTAKATPTASGVTYPSSLLTSIPVYHLVTTLAEHANSQQVPVPREDGTTQNPSGGQYGHSLYNWQGALCYDGRVYDHIRFRARGGVWRFAMGKNMWKFDFNRGHDFQARDNYGARFGQPWRKLNLSSCIQQGDYQHRGEQGLFESVGFRLFQLAGQPASHTNFTHFRIVSRASETGQAASQFDDDFQGLYLTIEQQDGQYLDEHDLPDGNLYKMEGGTGELNNQGPTQPKNKSDLVAFQNYGTTEEWWRLNADLPAYYNYRTIVDAIHHYDIGDGKNYFYYHDPVTSKWKQLPWDLDLTWSDNMYGGGSGIDGIGDSTEPFFSRIFGASATSGGIAPLKMELRNRARELLDLLVNSEQAGLLIDELASRIYQPGQPSFVDADRAMWDYNPILVSGSVNPSKAGHGRFYESAVNDPVTPQSEVGTFAGMMVKMKNYITTRRNVITTQLITTAEENLVPTTPTVTRTGSGPIPTNAMTFTTSAFAGKNGAAFAALKWRLAEVTDPAAPGFDRYNRTTRRAYEVEATWESPEITTFTSAVTIPAVGARPGGTYRVRVKHKDSAGRWSHWSAPVQFAAAEPDVGVYLNSLVVSQIMYHPSPPTVAEALAAPDAEEYEWLELMNVGPGTLDMTPVRLTKGVDFDFAGSAVTSLAPGGRVVVVKNINAWNARYGAGFPGALVAGSWQSGQSLSNGGEQLKVSFGAGTAIRDFSYDDVSPWPDGADGTGHGLVLANPAARPDHGDGTQWRLSVQRHGAPGQSDRLAYSTWAAGFGGLAAEVDSDGDGFTNLAEYALGTIPTSVASQPVVSATVDTVNAVHYLTLSFRQRLGADDAVVAAEVSGSLDAWTASPAAVALTSAQPNGDGTATMVYRSVTPIEAGQREFLRLRVSSPE